MRLLLSECWALFRYRTAKVLVFVSVWKVYCLLITPVFNCTGEQWLGGLFKGSILFRQQGFVWHLVLILLVYVSSLPNFSSNISCSFFPLSSFFPLIFLYFKRSFHYICSLPHRKSRRVESSLVLCVFHCFSGLQLMHRALEEGPCYITAPLWFSVHCVERHP